MDISRNRKTCCKIAPQSFHWRLLSGQQKSSSGFHFFGTEHEHLFGERLLSVWEKKCFWARAGHNCYNIVAHDAYFKWPQYACLSWVPLLHVSSLLQNRPKKHHTNCIHIPQPLIKTQTKDNIHTLAQMLYFWVPGKFYKRTIYIYISFLVCWVQCLAQGMACRL